MTEAEHENLLICLALRLGDVEESQYRTEETYGIIRENTGRIAHNTKLIFERLKNMDITGITNLTNQLTGIVGPLNDAAASIAASAQLISSGAGNAATDQTQLNTATGTLGTAVTAVVSGVTALQAAAKALADALNPPAPTTSTP
jgi:uncharacterized phage infection (PIP) family protein YhgE